MRLQGRVVDVSTGAGLPSATIAMDGDPVAVADSQGFFYIDTPTDAVNITASYVGYNTETMPQDALESSGIINLQKTDSSLPAVSVVAKIKSNPLPFALAAGGLGLLLFADKKQKKMGKIDTTTILLIGGGILAVYLLMNRQPAAPINPLTGLPYPATGLPVYGAPAGYQNPYLPPNTTAQDITAAGGAAKGILDAIANL